MRLCVRAVNTRPLGRTGMHQPVACDPRIRQLGFGERLTAQRLDRIAPQLRDVHDEQERAGARPYSYGDVRPMPSSTRLTATCSHQSRWKKSSKPSATSTIPLTTWINVYRSRSQRNALIARVNAMPAAMNAAPRPRAYIASSTAPLSTVPVLLSR